GLMAMRCTLPGRTGVRVSGLALPQPALQYRGSNMAARALRKCPGEAFEPQAFPARQVLVRCLSSLRPGYDASRKWWANSGADLERGHAHALYQAHADRFGGCQRGCGRASARRAGGSVEHIACEF